MNLNPKFSIIVPHYDGVISDDRIKEGMQSISELTYKNFEVLIYHDGPSSRPPIDFTEYGFKGQYKETKKRYNDWGHSLRDLGIKEATGDYIVHFNPDNLFLPNALDGIVEALFINKAYELTEQCIERKSWNRGNFPRLDEIIVCPIYMQGMLRLPDGSLGRAKNNNTLNCILVGYPVMRYNIDCMQLVASKKMWESYGGWYDKSEESDGKMYERMWNEQRGLFSQHPIGIHR